MKRPSIHKYLPRGHSLDANKDKSVESKKTSELSVIIDGIKAPNNKRLQEIQDQLSEEFELQDVKTSFKMVTAPGDQRVQVGIKLITCGNEPIMAAAERFVQLLGNVRVHKRLVIYRNEQAT